MIRAYITEMAAVRLAARLLNRQRIDNYAFLGALPAYSGIALGEVLEADGIPGVPEKAADFRFGNLCGEAIRQSLGDRSEEDRLAQDAQLARELLLTTPLERMDDAAREELRAGLPVILRALVKRAQIRTHTAKPGGEDIDAWLEGYYRLEQGYEPLVSALAEAVLSPAPKEEARRFFDRGDRLIALALAPEAPCRSALTDALAEEPSCLFGRILRDIATSSNDQI